MCSCFVRALKCSVFLSEWVRTSKNRPSFWFRSVDDTFALFDDKKCVSIFTISQQ